MVMPEKDAAYAFARTLVSTRYEDIPVDAAEMTKKCILDTLGTIVAASRGSPECKKLVDMVREWGGERQSTIIAFGGKVPCWMAAFANGSMAHALDYDNHLLAATIHPSCTTVPAGFAVAEHVGKVDGKRFITAVALGDDMICRLGLAVRSRSKKWMMTVPMGGFSAAAVASKLMGLSENQVMNAFGIALTQGGGSREMAYGVGADLRGMYAAFPNKTGVLSAAMAQRDITGPRNSLEGKGGFFPLFADGDYDKPRLTADLGKRFEGTGITFKPWPSCGRTHAYVDAAVAIVTEHDINPDDIDGITVSVNEFAQQLCEPLEARRTPATSMDAKYSVPFSTAVAVARRKPAIKDFTPEGIKDPLVLKIAHRVTPRFDPQLSASKRVTPGVVDIRTRDGQSYSKRVDVPYGHAGNPITMERLVEKFRDCASYSANPLPKGNVDAVVSMVANLEDVKDVSEIVRLLS